MGDLVHIHLRTATSLKAEISKMIVKIFVIIGIVIAASAVNQGDDDSLVKERKELSEERKEITELFRRETEKLRQEDGQLRAKLEELHKRDEKHQDQNQKLQKRIAKLEKENQKLRRADSKINKVIRQRDQNETQEFDAKIKNSLRQNDVSSAIKKMMRNEINNFLTNERICVGDRISDHGANNGGQKDCNCPLWTNLSTETDGCGGSELRLQVEFSQTTICIDLCEKNHKFHRRYLCENFVRIVLLCHLDGMPLSRETRPLSRETRPNRGQ